MQVAPTVSGNQQQSAARPKFDLHTVQDVFGLADPEWLIEGLLEVGAQGVVYGPTGHGKTFVTLDWALCVATGRKWQGQAVKQGPVIYVVTEGGRGIKKRIAAWMQQSDVKQVDDAYFVLEAVQLRSPDDYKLLLSRIQERGLEPALIVFDTFARCFVGGDENTSKEVGEFIDAARRLQETTGASLLLVHHTGKDGDKERGSSALRAAADVMFKVSKNGDDVVVLENDKQKDSEEHEKFRLRLLPVHLAPANGSESPVTSCVVASAGAVDEPVVMNPSKKIALEVLYTLGTAASGAWRKAVAEARSTKVSRKTFDNWRADLLEGGFVESLVADKHSYQLTAKGRASISILAPSETNGENQNASAASATPPIGVAGQHDGGNEEEASDDPVTWWSRIEAEIGRVDEEPL
jgi:hypothetical protein